jgi:hypothetical protein
MGSDGKKHEFKVSRHFREGANSCDCLNKRCASLSPARAIMATAAQRFPVGS